MAAEDFAGELVIEWPDSGGDYRQAPAGRQVVVYEHRAGSGLTLLTDVVSLTLHASPASLITATLIRHRELATEESTWVVVGMRMRAQGA
jgi:hypothetical protein